MCSAVTRRIAVNGTTSSRTPSGEGGVLSEPSAPGRAGAAALRTRAQVQQRRSEAGAAAGAGGRRRGRCSHRGP